MARKRTLISSSEKQRASRHSPNFWTRQRILADARKYTTVKEWALRSPNARVIAVRMRIYKEATAHMKRLIKPPGYWSADRIAKEARKFSSRLRFSQARSRAYQLALEMGIIDRVCSHMTSSPRIWKGGRSLYVVRFSDGAVYIGITLNPFDRLHEHMKLERGAVVEYSRRLGGEIPKFEVLISDLNPAKAKKLETKTVEDFRRRGLNVINRARPGVLGSRTRYTERELYAIAARYRMRSEFFKMHPGAYDAARSRGLLEKVCSHMVRRRVWTTEAATMVARRFKNRNEWWRKSPGSYRHIEKAGLLDEVMPKKTRTWTIQNALAEGRRFKSRTEWQQGSAYSYFLVKRAGILDQVMPSRKIRIRKQKRH